ncbi:MAG: leucyl aminopeptidase family protein [Candidatus Moranbacteria bacterium]|nr:leucyl aminopeptidase family protein [Candidatus Moranbacteria bacterium]
MKISIIDKKKINGKGFVNIVFNEKIAESRLVLDGLNETLEIKALPREKLNWRQATLIPRKIIFFAKKYGIKKLSLDWENIASLNLGQGNSVAEIFATNFEMANYEFVAHKTIPKEGWNFVEEIRIGIGDKNKMEKFFKKGQLIGQETNVCRELANMPGGDMTPSILADSIKKSIAGTGIKMNVLEEKEMKKLKMESILGVGKGSTEKPKFIILEYKGAESKNPIVFIGKGVTYDTGGLNLKPGDSMNEMNMDMSGGAAVAHAIIAAAKLKIKQRVIGLIPIVENMPSGESYRPGDIIKSMSGQTIEVNNTDAEGRIILADAHTYAERYNPSLVVNVATLTGAASVALGERASAIFTTDIKLESALRDLGEKSGDYVWPLPLWNEYEVEIKGVNADICNTRSQGNTRYGGTILGAMFIYQFAKKFPAWAHIDIAPRMTSVFDEFLARGAAGTPVRLLVKLLEDYR